MKHVVDPNVKLDLCGIYRNEADNFFNSIYPDYFGDKKHGAYPYLEGYESKKSLIEKHRALVNTFTRTQFEQLVKKMDRYFFKTYLPRFQRILTYNDVPRINLHVNLAMARMLPGWPIDDMSLIVEKKSDPAIDQLRLPNNAIIRLRQPRSTINGAYCRTNDGDQRVKDDLAALTEQSYRLLTSYAE